MASGAAIGFWAVTIVCQACWQRKVGSSAKRGVYRCQNHSEFEYGETAIHRRPYSVVSGWLCFHGLVVVSVACFLPQLLPRRPQRLFFQRPTVANRTSTLMLKLSDELLEALELDSVRRVWKEWKKSASSTKCK